jgi:hypothetical protein
MIHACSLLLAALVSGQGQSQNDLGYAPPDPVLPVPLYNPRPEDGVFLTFGPGLLGFGWKFADGSTVETIWRWNRPPEVRGCGPLWETEDQRVSWVTSGTAGPSWQVEQYLGHDFAAVLEGLTNPGLEWYPIEGVVVGLRLFRGLSIVVLF